MDQRERILLAAARLAARKGFDSTSMRDIARAAGVGVGTPYLYFKNKRSILTALLSLLSWDPTSALESARAARSATQACARLLDEWLQFLRTRPDCLTAVVAAALCDARLARQLQARVLQPVEKALSQLLKAKRVSDSSRKAHLLARLALADLLLSLSLGAKPADASALVAAALSS